MNITDLPQSTLLHIFSYLDIPDRICRVRRTCKLFYDLSYDFTLWRELKLDQDNFHIKFTDDLFFKLLNGVSEYVEDLIFGDHHLLTDRALYHAKITCPNLKNIHVSHAFTEMTTVIANLVTKYPNLEGFGFTSLDKEPIEEVLKNISLLTKLKSLSIYVPPTQEEDTANIHLSNFFKCFPSLCKLSVNYRDLSDMTVQTILENSPHIETLKLSGCECIAYEGFLPINKTLHNLTFVDLSYTYLDDEGMKKLTTHSPNLNKITIKGCISITDIGITHLATNCKELKSLIINTDKHEIGCNITNVGLQCVASGCPKLEVLYVNHCPNISDIGIITVSEGCKQLLKLGISGCVSLSDNALVSIASNCPLLRVLDLSECVQITCIGINNLILNCRWLKELDLETCHYLANFNFDKFFDTEKFFHGKQNFEGFACQENTSLPVPVNSSTSKSSDFESIISELTELPTNVNTPDKSLELNSRGTTGENKSSGNERKQSPPALNAEALISLAKMKSSMWNHSHITSLYLSFCSKIANDSVKQISRHCPDLQELSLRGCYSITDDAIEVLVECCQAIKTLDISGGYSLQTTKLTNRSLLAIAKSCKRLQKLMVCKNNFITGDAIHEVCISCDCLQRFFLSVGRPSQVTIEALMGILKQIPDKCVKVLTELMSTKTVGSQSVEMIFYPQK